MGNTALHLASMRELRDIIPLLYHHNKIDTHIKNNLGDIPKITRIIPPPHGWPPHLVSLENYNLFNCLPKGK